jgi:hypothetical protein
VILGGGRGKGLSDVVDVAGVDGTAVKKDEEDEGESNGGVDCRGKVSEEVDRVVVNMLAVAVAVAVVVSDVLVFWKWVVVTWAEIKPSPSKFSTSTTSSSFSSSPFLSVLSFPTSLFRRELDLLRCRSGCCCCCLCSCCICDGLVSFGDSALPSPPTPEGALDGPLGMYCLTVLIWCSGDPGIVAAEDILSIE